MSEDFSKTATPKGHIPRKAVQASVKSLKATVRTSTNKDEIMNAMLMLERLGETIE